MRAKDDGVGDEADSMKATTRFRFVLAAALLGTATALPAREVGMQEAVAQAQKETDGKVLSVQTLRVGRHKMYRIKILTRDGQVRIVTVQAEQ